jgi:hypothetical protein
MARLTFSHKISERRNFGKTVVNQEMVIAVDYDPEEDSIDLVKVDVYQEGIHIAEISKLLDKAEGNPLTTMIEAINWQELYADQKVLAEETNHDSEPEEGSIMSDMFGIKSLLDKITLSK